jgi:hypothetical protein
VNRHERRKQQKMGQLAVSKGPSTQIPIDKLGPAGIPGELSVLAIFPHDERQDAERLADKSQRTITVYATLSKTPPLNENIKGDTTANDGASYLAAPDEAAHLEFQSSEGSFRILKNQVGELSFVEFECTCDGIHAARCLFQRAVLPAIDHLSYVNNCPIFIGTVRFDDVKNHRQTIYYVSPYQSGTVNNSSSAVVHDKMRPVYAMYREAKNAASYFYKFLCYYKILEGLLNKMRAALFKAAREEKVEIKTPKLVVPDHSELPDHMRPHIGKPLRDFFDNALTPQFRNAVAHFVTDDGSILNTSAPEHLANYAGTTLICELCVQAAIADHEYLLRQLP